MSRPRIHLGRTLRGVLAGYSFGVCGYTDYANPVVALRAKDVTCLRCKRWIARALEDTDHGK